MATPTLDTRVPDAVVLHHDHGSRSQADFDRLVDKARAARLLGLEFTLSTHSEDDGRHCLDLEVSVSEAQVETVRITRAGLSLVRDDPDFERALIAHTAEAIAELATR